MIDTTNFTDQEKEEYEMFLRIQASPEYGILPLPARWYKLFNIEPVKAQSAAEFIKSNYTMKCSFADKDLPPIIINEPQQNGKLVDLIKEEEIPIEVIVTPYNSEITSS